MSSTLQYTIECRDIETAQVVSNYLLLNDLKNSTVGTNVYSDNPISVQLSNNLLTICNMAGETSIMLDKMLTVHQAQESCQKKYMQMYGANSYKEVEEPKDA